MCSDNANFKAHLDLVAKYQEQGFQLQKLAAKLEGQVISDEQLRLQNATIPATKYTGSKWSTLAKQISQICTKQFPGHHIERVVIRSDWSEKTEARWRHHRWVYGTYRYIEAWMCKTHNNKTFVYSITLRRTRQSDGKWSDLAYWSIGDSYPILLENVHK